MLKEKTMPYIEIKTNINLTKEQDEVIKSRAAGILAASFPGKTENWLMVNIEGGHEMYFAGSDGACMMIDVAIFGKQSSDGYDKMTRDMCAFIDEEFGIAKDRVYIKYSEYTHWGWNGVNF